MATHRVFSLLLIFFVGLSLSGRLRRAPGEYKAFQRDDSVVDDYFGTKVSDPYRWLEDIDSDDTQNFVETQQSATEAYLSKISIRKNIRDKLTEVWNYPKVGTPDKVNGKYYYFANSGLQNQSVMYVKDALDKDSTVFIDPNKFSDDGTIALNSYTFTDDGSKLVYTVSQSGSDWVLVRFKNVQSKEDYTDVLKDTKWPEPSWSKDGQGVFYAKYPTGTQAGNVTNQKSEVTENAKIYYHKLGTPQSEDILIAEFPESPQRIVSCYVTRDGKYAVITGQKEFSANTVHIIDLSNGIDETLKDKLVPIFPDEAEATYNYVTHKGSDFIFMTTKDAPNYKLIKVKIDMDPLRIGPDGRAAVKITDFLPEDPKNVLNWASVVASDKLVVCYSEDVKHILQLRKLNDASLIQKLDIPLGTVGGFSREDPDDKEFFFSFTNFVSPGTIYRCVVNDLAECSVYDQINVGKMDLSKFAVEQVFFPSKDGTKVPMFVVRKKSVPLDGQSPTILYGYGGFNVVLKPSFSVSTLTFIDEFNGTYAMANLRGGGEYGEAWHQAGARLKKQNVFDDFQSAAEYLVTNNYTSPAKLAIQGGSNGGLLVGACVNQRPDLYGAAIAQVGVMDLLRFQHFTIGYAWCPEYGCSDNQTDFDNLVKLSPLHNIRVPEKEGVQYPAVLVTTADHDDRVVPAHSYKYVAELQHTVGQSSKQTNPLLLRVDIKAGHGTGKPTAKRIEETADIYAFLVKNLGIDYKG